MAKKHKPLSDRLPDYDAFMGMVGALAVLAMERDYLEAETLRRMFATYHAGSAASTP